MKIKVKINRDSGLLVRKQPNLYCQFSHELLFNLIFPRLKNDLQIVNNKDDNLFENDFDMELHTILLTKEMNVDLKKINIMICNENIAIVERKNWYPHYTQFGHYGDNRIQIYFYNDISCVENNEKYIGIPFVYLYIDYYQEVLKSIKFNLTSFENKKFCLFVSRNFMNDNKKIMVAKLSRIGLVDPITKYDSLIKSVSCFYAKELLEIFNQYKFVVCFENSFADGYLTEKIFNVFLAKSIPIYNGPRNTNSFIRDDCYLNFNDPSLFEKIVELNNDKNKYDEFVNKDKIVNNYDNENWDILVKEKIEKYMNK